MAVGILSKGHQDVVGMQDEHVLLGQKGQKAISRSQIASLQATLLVVVYDQTQVSVSGTKIKSKCISRKSDLMPCHNTFLNCFALEHIAFKTKHLKVS